MFPALYVTIAFCVMLAPGGVFSVGEKWLPELAKRIIIVVGVIAAIYVFAAGVHLYDGWDKWMESRSEDLSESAAHVRRGGLIVLFIKHLPYALMGLSGYMLYCYAYPIVRMLKGEKV